MYSCKFPSGPKSTRESLCASAVVIRKEGKKQQKRRKANQLLIISFIYHHRMHYCTYVATYPAFSNKPFLHLRMSMLYQLVLSSAAS